MSLGQIGKPAGRPNEFFLGTGDNIGGMRVELRPADQRAVTHPDADRGLAQPGADPACPASRP